jgi:hypothetical protein
MAYYTLILLNLAVASGAVIQTVQQIDLDQWRGGGSQQVFPREVDRNKLHPGSYDVRHFRSDTFGKGPEKFQVIGTSSEGRTLYRTKRFINPFNYIGSIFDEKYDITR